MHYATADLSDAHEDEVQICDPVLQDFGGRPGFWGAVATVQCFEDNSRVREALARPGDGRVLVVDGGGSTRCALLGDRLAGMALDNGWAGVLVHGCVRDSAAIRSMNLGVRALASHPRRSHKRGEGTTAVPVRFAGATFVPGCVVYCDADGILVAPRALL